MKEYNESEKEMWNMLEKKGFNRMCSAYGEKAAFPVCWISSDFEIMVDTILYENNFKIKSMSIFIYDKMINKLNGEIEGDVNFIEKQLNKYYEN